MEALHDVVKAGYVRYIGMSSCWAWQCKLQSLFVVVILLIWPFPAMQSTIYTFTR